MGEDLHSSCGNLFLRMKPPHSGVQRSSNQITHPEVKPVSSHALTTSTKLMVMGISLEFSNKRSTSAQTERKLIN